MRSQDEREERELRKVEMQTQKAENMIEHEAKIYARPPRTWFQTGVSPRLSHSHCFCHMLWLAIKRLSLFCQKSRLWLHTNVFSVK